MSKQNVEDIYPLSSSQQGMLLYLLVSGYRSEVYFDQFVATLTGELDDAAWRKAWQRTVDRHPALRTLFVWEKRDQPLQVVRRDVELPWREEDWRGLSEADREERLAAFLREDHALGFDFGKAPLMRVAVLHWADGIRKLVWSFSHLVLDGWSMTLVLGEVLSLYDSFVAGREPQLEKARPFRDYVSWLKQQDERSAEEYWRRTLAGFDPATPLPFDGTGGKSGDTGALSLEVKRRLPADLVRRLHALTRQHQVTLNTVFQGIWGLLIGRSAGHRDVVFGGVVSGRPHELEGVESMVGLFINALPVRVTVDPSRKLIPWLTELQTAQTEQRDFEHSSLEQIQKWGRMPRQTPLFESMLVFENYPVDPLRGGADRGFQIRDAHLGEAGNFPLTFYVVPGKESVEMKLSYHWKRFDEASANRLLAQVETLLTALAERPEGRLGDLSILGASDTRDLLAAGTGPVAEPLADPIPRTFEEQAARTPDAVALESAEGALTYAELNSRAGLLARHLRRLGVGPETIVGLAVERSPEMVVGMLGVWKAGGAYLPLDPAYPTERLAFMLEDSGASVLLTEERLLPRLSEAASLPAVLLDAQWEEIARIEREKGEIPAAGYDTGRAAYVIYTSGSTGRPKGVLVEHASVANYVRAARSEYGIGGGDRVLQFASISFDTSAEEIYPALTGGATLVLRDDAMVSSLDRFARAVGDLGITVLDLPTAYWHELVAEMEAHGLQLPASLRLVILGGEQAQRDRLAAWRGLAGERIRLVNTYGPTEATIVSTHRDLTGPGAKDFPGEVPIGRPVANARVYVADRNQELIPSGLEGELLIGGAGLARGYLGRPDLTAERFVPDPFSDRPGARLYRSGDLVRWISGVNSGLHSDSELQFRGRTDAQVKVRGYRIELGEIEAALRGHSSLRDAVVIAREDRPGEKRLVAYVVPQEGETLGIGELRTAIQQRLPEHMVPAAFVPVDELPLTPSGKVDRRALESREGDSLRPDLESDYAAPRTPVEEMLAGIWSELLSVERVGIHDDFFHLGGHSLLAAKLASRVRQAFRVELPMIEVFKTPTVAQLAEAVERAERAADVPELPPIRRVPRDRPLPLSFPQERVWFLDQLSAGGNLAYNFQVTIWFRGPMDVGVLHQTLSEIVRRHEVLRTSFPAVDGQPVQKIHPAGPVEMPVIDLRGVPAEERHDLSERLVFETTQIPFDISRPPLLRWRLLRLEDELYELIQVEHHFVHDGWSFAVLLREIKAIYPAFLAGQPSPLPELPVQYADFAAWQREWMEGEVMEHLAGYWRKKLAGNPGVLELPTDHPRPLRQSFRGDVELFLLPPQLYDALRVFSRKEGFTLYMTMTAAFLTLMHRYTGQEDILLGTSNANRRAREIEGMIGMVVNSLLLRGDLTGEPTFSELLERVRETTLEAYAHQDMPFERLVQELRPERQLGRNPLFQVMFNFHDAGVPDLQFGGLDVKFLVRGNRSAKMDMNIIIIPRAEQKAGQGGKVEEKDLRAILHWEYNTELFDPSTIRRMVGHYQTLLGAIVANPKQRLWDIPLLTEAEHRQVVIDWNRTRSFPAGDCLHDRFAAQAARTPETVAVSFADERLTYAELDRQSNRLAHHLRRQGVATGDLVGLCLERSTEMVVSILGVLKAGAAYVPLDPGYPAERLAFVLEDAQLRVLVTRGDLLDALPADHGARVVRLDQSADLLAAESAADPRAGAAPDHVAYVIYTSGSTGRPKGVPVPHRNVARLFTATDSWFGFGDKDVWTLFHSYAFDFSVWEIWGALLYGGRLVVVPYWVSRSPEEFHKLLVREGVTILNQTPSAFRQLVAIEETLGRQGEKPALTGLREVIFGGEALELASLAPWFARYGDQHPRLVNMYGITETTVHVTYRPIAAGDLEAAHRSPIGERIPDLELYVLDRRANPAPVGIPGELHVGGAGLAHGYLRRPALTAERFIPNPFSSEPGARLYRSGDLARFLPDGDIEYLGRIDDQVKIRGFRIELGEIEAALARHPAIRETVVMVRDDAAAPGEKRLVAYAVPRETEEDGDLRGALRSFLKQELPEHMIPSAFVLLPALPLTQNGKVDRKALPDPEAVRVEVEETYVAPRTPIEEMLAKIWSEVLGLPRVGITDDFFELGGHSLSAARVLARIREAVRAELPLSAIFENPTIETLVQVIAESAVQNEQERIALKPAGADDRLAEQADLSDNQLDALLGELMADGD